jgi:hypothetical protein
VPGTYRFPAGWDEDRDAFVTAVADLLAAGPLADTLTDPPATLAARDRVVAEVRTLISILSRAEPAPTPVTLQELVERPSVALAGALALLPTPAAYQQGAPSDPLPPQLPEYERLWHEAARRAALLEQHVDALRRLPPEKAGQVLTQLGDVAAALVPLDADLAATCQASPDPSVRACLPALTQHTGHTAVRLCAAEVRLADLMTIGRQEPSAGKSSAKGVTEAAARGARPGQGVQPQGPVVLNDLGTAMAAVESALGERGPALTVPELRAVAVLLETGAAHNANVLRRAGTAVPGAQDVADALLPLVDTANGLRRVPARSLTRPRTEVPTLCGEIRLQLARLGTVATRLPHATSATDLRRLAIPALAWAIHVQPVTDALTTAVQAGLDSALLAVPTELRTRRGPALLWTPASSSAEPPRILARAHDLREIAGPVTHAALRAQAAQHRAPGATRRALAVQAAAGAGAAPTTLGHALAARTSTLAQPGPDPLTVQHPGQTNVRRLGAS